MTTCPFGVTQMFCTPQLADPPGASGGQDLLVIGAVGQQPEPGRGRLPPGEVAGRAELRHLAARHVADLVLGVEEIEGLLASGLLLFGDFQKPIAVRGGRGQRPVVGSAALPVEARRGSLLTGDLASQQFGRNPSRRPSCPFLRPGFVARSMPGEPVRRVSLVTWDSEFLVLQNEMPSRDRCMGANEPEGETEAWRGYPALSVRFHGENIYPLAGIES